MALIMTVYKMKRCINILGLKDLIEKIKIWVPDYKGVTHTFQKPNILERIKAAIFLSSKHGSLKIGLAIIASNQILQEFTVPFLPNKSEKRSFFTA